MTDIPVPIGYLVFLFGYGFVITAATLRFAYAYWKLMDKAEALERRIMCCTRCIARGVING